MIVDKIKQAKRQRRKIMNIAVKITKQTLINGKWQTTDTLEKPISKRQYDLFIENRFKGDRYYKGYTYLGYITTKIVSRFEDLRSIKEFTFSK